MEDEFETKQEQSHITDWKNDGDRISSFFGRFDLDVRDLYKHITSIDYDRMRAICYLLSKIEIAIRICDFLDTLERDDYEDIDIIKIYILISHAEITSRSLGEKGAKIDLVKKFFSPVESNLKDRITPNLPPDGKALNMNFADILYKIRCEYTHEGNYTGRIFKRREDGTRSLLIRFKNGNKDFYGECGLIYKEFINIYMEALIENIKKFSDYGK
jgi:hypothetical protein